MYRRTTKKKMFFGNINIRVSKCFFNNNSLFFEKISNSISHVSTTTTVSCPKNKTFCLPQWYQLKLSLQTINIPKKSVFQEKNAYLQRFRKTVNSLLNINNLFFNSNSLFELSQSLLTNVRIVPARVAYNQRYKLYYYYYYYYYYYLFFYCFTHTTYNATLTLPTLHTLIKILANTLLHYNHFHYLYWYTYIT